MLLLDEPRTEVKPAEVRDQWGRFLPGNKVATGRPKGLASKISAATSDGQELVDWYLKVFRDEKADMRDRLTASAWLTERAWGKAIQATADVTDKLDPRGVLAIEWTDAVAEIAPSEE